MYKLEKTRRDSNTTMKSSLIVLAVLAIAPLIIADIDIDFNNVLPADDPEVGTRRSGERDFIGDLISSIQSKIGVPHIVGGYVVEPHSYPHQVAVISKNDKGQTSLCGGSLITTQWVLTAAHCAMNVKSMIAVMGAHNISEREPSRQAIQVKSVLKHKLWNPRTVENDIALLSLLKPAQLNDNVQLIRLPSQSLSESELEGKPVDVAGWGKFTDRKLAISQVLRAAGTKTISNDDCNDTYMGKIQHHHVCADGSEAKGVCNGDSGGPMILTEEDGVRTVVGITSFGRREGCEKRFPTVFTRVSSYLEWIRKITGVELRA